MALRIQTGVIYDEQKQRVADVQGSIVYSSGSFGLVDSGMAAAQPSAQFILDRHQALDSRWAAGMFLRVDGKEFSIISVVPNPGTGGGVPAYFDLSGGYNVDSA